MIAVQNIRIISFVSTSTAEQAVILFYPVLWIFINLRSVQDKDRDGRISYEEFMGKKTLTEIAFEVK